MSNDPFDPNYKPPANPFVLPTDDECIESIHKATEGLQRIASELLDEKIAGARRNARRVRILALYKYEKLLNEGMTISEARSHMTDLQLREIDGGSWIYKN